MNAIPIVNWTAVKNMNAASTLRFPPAKAYVLHRGVHINIRKSRAILGSPNDHEDLNHQRGQDDEDKVDDGSLSATGEF